MVLGIDVSNAESTGAVLRSLRKRNHLTQSQLAQRTGIDQGQISQIETSKVNPSAKTLLRILASLVASDEELLRILSGMVGSVRAHSPSTHHSGARSHGQALALARAALDTGNMAAAFAELTAALDFARRIPSTQDSEIAQAQVFEQLGGYHKASGNTSAAEQAYRSAKRLYAANGCADQALKATGNLANLWASSGEYALAIALAEQVIQHGSGSRVAWASLTRAIALEGLEQDGPAQQAYTTACARFAAIEGVSETKRLSQLSWARAHQLRHQAIACTPAQGLPAVLAELASVRAEAASIEDEETVLLIDLFTAELRADRPALRQVVRKAERATLGELVRKGRSLLAVMAVLAVGMGMAWQSAVPALDGPVAEMSEDEDMLPKGKHDT